jgi:hypothetical protein
MFQLGRDSCKRLTTRLPTDSKTATHPPAVTVAKLVRKPCAFAALEFGAPKLLLGGADMALYEAAGLKVWSLIRLITSVQPLSRCESRPRGRPTLRSSDHVTPRWRRDAHSPNGPTKTAVLSTFSSLSMLTSFCASVLPHYVQHVMSRAVHGSLTLTSQRTSHVPSSSMFGEGIK